MRPDIGLDIGYHRRDDLASRKPPHEVLSEKVTRDSERRAVEKIFLENFHDESIEKPRSVGNCAQKKKAAGRLYFSSFFGTYSQTTSTLLQLAGSCLNSVTTDFLTTFRPSRRM